jgi:transcriptional regulator with XRE-family HTH domain
MLDHIGFPRTTWSSYENNVSQPDIDGLLKIARFFNISVSELLEEDLSERGDWPSVGNDELSVKKRGRRNKAGEGSLSSGREDLLAEIIRTKEEVIETQAQTIRALQQLVDRLALDETGSGERKG